MNINNTTNQKVYRLLLGAIVIITCPAVVGGKSTNINASHLIARRIKKIVATYQHRSHAIVALHAIDISNGTTLCSIAADKLMIPASNAKILTSAIALKRLGKEFKFTTKLAIRGNDLVVIGDGDPTTGDARLAKMKKKSIYATFDEWAEILKQRGIKQIRGNLVIEAGIFQQPCLLYTSPSPRD